MKKMTMPMPMSNNRNIQKNYMKQLKMRNLKQPSLQEDQLEKPDRLNGWNLK
jgi:hypothetical protein